MKRILLISFLLTAVVLGFPMIEEAQDTIVSDAAISKTCFDRHGYNFVSRWSCRSSLHQGIVVLGIGCAFNEEIDICKNLVEMRRKAAAGR
jgi:hypothetical protein